MLCFSVFYRRLSGSLGCSGPKMVFKASLTEEKLPNGPLLAANHSRRAQYSITRGLESKVFRFPADQSLNEQQLSG